MKFAQEPGRMELRWPDLGEHTESLLEELGHDAAARAQLKDDGVI